jgi:UDP:flavonoid glycosyltransferase YjiC (YdhE family)
MRIVMATFGTTGDVQPFLALGVELLRRGHRVLLGGPANFAARVEGLGLEFVALGAAADGQETRRLFTSACELRDVNDQVQATLPYALEHAEASVRTLLEVAAGADALLSIPYQAAGRITAELLGLPHVSVHFSPFGSGRRPRISAIAAPGFNACRALFGLGPVADPLGADGISADLALTPVSRALFPATGHPGGHRHTTGFWFLDEPARVDPELAAFVADGPPPAVLGFGSMTHGDPAAVARVLVEAVRLAGIRAVIQTGWSGLELPEVPEGILFAPFVPHSWLFPRAGCIVHAGGAGTSAAAFRAGVPAVFVPHWLDQYLWGALAVERRLASASIPLAELGAERLAEAMLRALDEPRYRVAAAAVAAAIQAEDGVREAADRLEGLRP